MVNLPIEVAECLKRLRSEHSHYVAVKVIGGKHYAFEVTSRWNRERKRSVAVTHYLGRIKNDGTFVPAHHRHNTETAATANNGPEIAEDKYDKAILTNLSMNGRMPTPALAGRIGSSAASTAYWRNKTEEKYGIRYFAEIDTEKLGYMGYLVFVKFNDKIPHYEEIKQSIEGEATIQLATLTSGEYDLVMYVLTTGPKDLAYLIYNLRANTPFSKYPSFWYTTANYFRSHTIPLRDEFFELLEKRVWHRTKEKPRPGETDITEREYNVLRELNANGSIGFGEIDKKYGYGKGASRYTYIKLMEKGVLKRVTVNLTRLSLKYIGFLFLDFVDISQFKKVRAQLLLEAIKDAGVVNKYSLANDTGAPEGFLMVMPVFTGDDAITTEDEIKRKVKGIRFRKLIATKTIIGAFCFRRFDATYTNQYRLLVEEYGLLKDVKRQDYGEMR
jgi:DNA-binding Lrp family transcriptional regulator